MGHNVESPVQARIEDWSTFPFYITELKPSFLFASRRFEKLIVKSRKRFGRQRGSGFVNLQSLSGFKFQFLSVLISQIPVEAEAYVLGFYPVLCLFCSSDQNIQPWPVVGISFTELCHTSSMSFWSIASPTGTSTSYNLT